MKTLAVLFLVLALSACDAKKHYRQAADDTVTTTDEYNIGRTDYKLYIPAGWNTFRQTAYGIDYYFLKPPVKEADAGVVINVISHGIPMPWEKYSRKMKKMLLESVPGVVLVDEGTFEGKALKGEWFSYDMDIEGHRTRLVCYMYPYHGIVYLITGGTKVEYADDYRAVFDRVAKSFRFED
ncbi:hypothetical protein [Chitinophaga sp. Cy-1792]|uniref:hypothetical protein n=1 Tax=Chitinophaga sp. Cy-1792 TaxID=2608339 RepID=UPI00141FC525|nr:hypothetical protein [Chitinophaga sp. Cy-1792]NIG55885.1 hypothetical protein [Chitinophaga sp. Cy-1792]